MATSYANAGGTGNRTASITVTTTANLDGGTIDRLVDGANANGAGSACFFAAASNANGVYIRFQFATQKVIDEAKWYQNGSASQGTWKWQGSDNGSSWSDLSADFTLDGGSAGSVIGDLSANTTGFYYYQIVKTGGTTNDTPWLREIEFKIDDFTPSETDLPAASATVGITEAVSLSTQIQVTVAASLGLEMAVTLSRILALAATTHTVGIEDATSFGSEISIPASAHTVGVTMAAAVVRELALPAASPGVGVTMAVALYAPSFPRQPVIIIIT